jgi:hypothetical protein
MWKEMKDRIISLKKIEKMPETVLFIVVRTRPHPVCTYSNDSVDQVAFANINSFK